VVIVGISLIVKRLVQKTQQKFEEWTKPPVRRMNRRDGSRTRSLPRFDYGASFMNALRIAAGGGLGSGYGNPIWMAVWMSTLMFVAFPISGVSATWYILLNPFTLIFDGLNPFTDGLLRGVQFTHFCAEHMMKGTPVLEAFK